MFNTDTSAEITTFFFPWGSPFSERSCPRRQNSVNTPQSWAVLEIFVISERWLLSYSRITLPFTGGQVQDNILASLLESSSNFRRNLWPLHVTVCMLKGLHWLLEGGPVIEKSVSSPQHHLIKYFTTIHRGCLRASIKPLLQYSASDSFIVCSQTRFSNVEAKEDKHQIKHKLT